MGTAWLSEIASETSGIGVSFPGDNVVASVSVGGGCFCEDFLRGGTARRGTCGIGIERGGILGLSDAGGC